MFAFPPRRKGKPPPFDNFLGSECPMADAQYGEDYFAWQFQPNVLGIPRGDRPFLYGFWMRYLRRRCLADRRVLEVGCGPGFFLKRLCGHYQIAVGLDVSRTALAQGRALWGVTVVQGDAQALPMQPGSFGALIAFDVIEHLSRPERFLAEAHEVLEPGGLMIISTPNPHSLGARLKPSRWFAYRDGSHISIRRMEDWRRSFREMGFMVERDGTDMPWDPPYVTWLPLTLQKLMCLTAQWSMTWVFGFFQWTQGENYIAILRRQ